MAELAESIQSQGLQQLPVVNFTYLKGGKAYYDLNSEERRYHAHKLLRKETVRCVVEEKTYDGTLVTAIKTLYRLAITFCEERRYQNTRPLFNWSWGEWMFLKSTTSYTSSAKHSLLSRGYTDSPKSAARYSIKGFVSYKNEAAYSIHHLLQEKLPGVSFFLPFFFNRALLEIILSPRMIQPTDRSLSALLLLPRYLVTGKLAL